MQDRKTQKIDKKKYKEERKYFIMRKPELAQLAKSGDERASHELQRRAQKMKKKKRLRTS